MRVSVVAAALAVGMLSGCVLTGCASAGVGDPSTATVADGPLVVADTGTPVQSVLAHIYAGALVRGGASVSVTDVDGTSAALDGLDDASVSMVPSFTGSLLTQLDPRSEARNSEDVYSDLARALPEWLSVSDQGLAENGPTMSVTGPVASTLGEATVSALTPQCGRLSVGVDPAVDGAAVTAALSEVYDCTFASSSVTGDPAVTVRLATDRPVDAGTTDVLLADDRDGFRAEYVVPLFRKGAVDEGTARPLQVVAGELTTADLAEMVERVRGGEDPAVVAESWLGRLTI